MIQSGYVLYTYTKSFACFAESVFLMTRRVLPSQFFCWVRCVFAESVFAESVFFADKARYCWVSFVESVICWRGTYRRRWKTVYWCEHWPRRVTVAEGPHDAESCFRAETYYIRVLNVLPVFAESVFLLTRRIFAESVFFWVSFCWVISFC